MYLMYSNVASFVCVYEQTSGMTALHDLSTTPGLVTSASTLSSPSAEPTEAQSELEQSPSQDELSTIVTSVSPATTQPSHDTEAAEETDLPPESGKLSESIFFFCWILSLIQCKMSCRMM